MVLPSMPTGMQGVALKCTKSFKMLSASLARAPLLPSEMRKFRT